MRRNSSGEASTKASNLVWPPRLPLRRRRNPRLPLVSHRQQAELGITTGGQHMKFDLDQSPTFPLSRRLGLSKRPWSPKDPRRIALQFSFDLVLESFRKFGVAVSRPRHLLC